MESGGNRKMFLFHGTIHITIFKIEKLPSEFDIGQFAASTSGRIVQWVRNVFLPQAKYTYVTIGFDGTIDVGRSRKIKYPHPDLCWDERFQIYCAHRFKKIVFTVTIKNPVGETIIGRANLPASEIFQGQLVDKWIRLLDIDQNPIPGFSKLHVKVHFIHVTRENNWSKGITEPTFEGVQRTFFKQRQGCKVTLYQDAHVLDDYVPKFILSGGVDYEPGRCWEDVFHAISNAKYLIYIAGWSIYTKITLIRDSENNREDIKLGDLLKEKANQGLRVALLIWHDTMSHDQNKEGIMKTHDQETKDFFRNSKVNCVLCPRKPDDETSIFEEFKISMIFTHHQKTIVVDAEPLGAETQNRRRIISFLGGIDLCNGRYDTPMHSLFGTLDSVHKDDFYQPNFKGSSIEKGGPRMPWHDIHCMLEGPIAWDVLHNFEQRWQKQKGNSAIYNTHELDRYIGKPMPATNIDDPQSWNVQLFRSIDEREVSGFPSNWSGEVYELGLVSDKDVVIDMSIQDGYINAIRRAKNFIYIENQYFLGSSFGWNRNLLMDYIFKDNVGALHLIPKELSLKIVSKIHAREMFRVYVVIPMWPEGKPESAVVQTILHWQKKTMEMMYKDIAMAIKATGQDSDPRDYLTFFCLGNREIQMSEEYTPPNPKKPEVGTSYRRAQEARRFMIYVHSKMMIVDDEYIIIGSANINQRSMDGARDSEIAMGGYQPHHLANNHPARGHIYGFRMALWREHLGDVNELYLHPESLDCVKLVNKKAQNNWELYAAVGVPSQDLCGHLLRYPVNITQTGEVKELVGFKCFPDTGAPVLGSMCLYLPTILTS